MPVNAFYSPTAVVVCCLLLVLLVCRLQDNLVEENCIWSLTYLHSAIDAVSVKGVHTVHTLTMLIFTSSHKNSSFDSAIVKRCMIQANCF